jgi:hypothetical protein
MHLEGPHQFEITVVGEYSYAVKCRQGKDCFHAPVTTRSPKLYVFAERDRLLYIGQTVQGMSARMRLGFQADGTGGYYGYRWRSAMQMATCHVWCLLGVAEEDEIRALECIESEVVFGYRHKFDQWPPYQTEIHFHASTAEHRDMAQIILNAFPARAV